jgi:beta-catenin-like protein 1
LKVLNHTVSGPEGLENANKIIDILGLRTIFPLFMKTPKKTKRKGLTTLEHEEHVTSILAGLIQHVTGQSRSRILIKFEENDFEKLERLVELHFKYSEKVQIGDREMKQSEEFDSLDDDEIYLRRLDNGLFTLQLADYIIVEACASGSKIKERLLKLLQLRKGDFQTILDTVKEYAENIGDENPEWKMKQQNNIANIIENL